MEDKAASAGFRYPYTIASAHDFEMAIQVLAQVGIAAVMQKKTSAAMRWYWLYPFLTQEFPGQQKGIKWDLQREEMEGLLAVAKANLCE